MRTLSRIFSIAFVALTLASPASAELLSYTDADGASHYVDSHSKIPDQFRSSAIDLETGRGISRAGVANYSTENRSESAGAERAPAIGAPVPSGASRSSKRVEVFVTDYCPYCKSLERYLNERKIKYTRYNIGRDQKAQREFKAINGTGVPITRIGNALIPGFDQAAIEKALS